VCTSSARTVSFISASGGVGKTTLALGLASFLYLKRQLKRLLLVDLDPTAGLSLSVLSDEEYDKLVESRKTLSDMLRALDEGRNVSVDDYRVPKVVGRVAFDLLVPGEELSYHMDNLWRTGRPGDVFKGALRRAGVYDRYDFVIFDSAPFFDQRYTVVNLYASERYVVVLRPSLIDLKRTIRMLSFLARIHGEALAGSSQAFFNRFLGVFNMVESRTKEGGLISSVLSGRVQEVEPRLKDMERYMEQLRRVIEVPSAYLSLRVHYARLAFLRGLEGGEFREARDEFLRLMESILSWLTGARQVAPGS